MMGFLGELRCANCGSENHFITSCPRLGEQHTVITGGTRTCEVNIGGITTKYVSKQDHERIVQDLDAARIVLLHRNDRLQAEIAKVKRESDWQWHRDSIEAMQRRYEAELDIYRVPPGYKRVPCCCYDKHSYNVVPDRVDLS